MSVVEIENELKKMTNAERRVVFEIATKLVRSDISESRQKLRKSAEIMLSEYTSNKGLTDLTELDGEDFFDV